MRGDGQRGVNSRAGRVRRDAFGGVAGDRRRSYRELVFEQLAWFAEFIRESSRPVRLVGVGGLGQAADVVQALGQGCEAVQFATAAMLNPGLGLAIRREGFNGGYDSFGPTGGIGMGKSTAAELLAKRGAKISIQT